MVRVKSAGISLVAAALCFALMQPTVAVAQQTLYWSGTSGTSAPLWTTLNAWSTVPGGWSAGSTPSSFPGANDTAVFSVSGLTGAQSVYLGGDQSALGLTFSSTTATTLLGGSGAGSPAVNWLTLGTGGLRVRPSGTAAPGAVTIGSGGADNVNVRLGGSQTWDVAGSLVVRGTVAGSAATGASQTLTVGNGSSGFGSTTLAGVVSDGTAGGMLNLTQAGRGVLRLTNSANSYSGTTTVSGGLLVVSSNGALGTGNSAVIVTDNRVGGVGSGIMLDGSQGSVTLSRNLDLRSAGTDNNSATSPNGNFALTSVGNNTLSGLITGSNNVRLISIGELTISGTLNQAANEMFLGMPGNANQGLAAGVRRILVTGGVSGAGGVQAGGYAGGFVLFNPTTTANWGGVLKVMGGEGASVRITNGANGVLGTTGTVNMSGGILEVRMDSPKLQSASGANAVVATGGGTLWLDHGLGSTQTGGTLVLGSITNGQVVNSRNGYGFEVGNITGNLQNDGSGRVTITGTLAASAGVYGLGSMTSNLAGPSNSTFTRFAGGSGGLFTIATTGGSYSGIVDVQGGLAITDFRSIGNVSGTTRVGGYLVIGTDTAPGVAADLTSQRSVIFNAGSGGSAGIFASQSGTNPVVINTLTTGQTGAKTLLLGGTSTAANTISAAIVDNTGATKVQKTGLGTWVLSGVNTYSGSTRMLGGTLQFNANAGASNVMPSGNFVFEGDGSQLGSAAGTLVFKGFLNTTTTETTGTLVQSTNSVGAANVNVVNNGAATTLTFAALSQSAFGDTVNYNPDSSSVVAFTTAPTLTNGLMVAATVGNVANQFFRGTDFATYSSGSVTAATYTTTLPTSGVTGSATNYSMSANHSMTGSTQIHALKIVGGGTPPTLTLSNTLNLSAKTVLFDNSAGAATITGGQLGAGGELLIYTGGSTPGNALTVNSPILSGSSTLFTKAGSGLLVLGGSNGWQGNFNVNEGSVQFSGATATLGALGFARYTNLRQGTTLDINAAGPSATINVGGLNGIGTVTNSGGASGSAEGTVVLGDASGAANFQGILQDGAGKLNVTKSGANLQELRGRSTYTGVTTINSGSLSVDVLVGGGTASGIGMSSNAAANLVFNGTSTLVYSGTVRSIRGDNQQFESLAQTTVTDRLFTLGTTGTATIASNADRGAALVWSSTGSIAHSGVGARTLNLAGSSTGDNAFFPKITDSDASNRTSLRKSGAGTWLLTGTDNTYTGITTIAEGNLGFTGLNGSNLPANSPLQVGVTGTVGTLLMSGTLTRTVAATPTPNTNTITLTEGSSGGAGFAALGEKLVVAFQQSGTLQPLTWGSGGFLGTSGTLRLGSAAALGEVEFRNPIDLNTTASGTRFITFAENINTGGDFATLSGNISGTGNLSISNAGAGAINNAFVLSGSNTYEGRTLFTGTTGRVTLVVSSLGSNTASASSSLGRFVSGSAGSLTIDGDSPYLQYVGSGEVADRQIRVGLSNTHSPTYGGPTIDSAGTGPLVLTDVVIDGTTPASLWTQLRLTSQNAFDNEIRANLADATGRPLALVIAGRWILSGSNTLTGSNASANAITNTVGSMGFGSDFAVPATGRLSAGGGSFFAHGGDRTVSGTLVLGAHTTFYGDYNLTFSNPVPTGASYTVTNLMADGEALTFNNGVAFTNAAATLNTLTLSGTGRTVINGNIGPGSGTGAITVSGSGNSVVALAGTNTYTGTTAVSAGVLSVSSTAALPGWTTLNRYTVAAGAALVVGNNVTDAEFSSLRTSGNVSTANAAIGFDTSAGNRDYGSAIANPSANALGLMKIGSGTLTLSAANTYTGTTTVREGTLRLGVGNAISGASQIVLGSTGLISFGTAVTSATVSGITGTSVIPLVNDASQAVTLSLGGNNGSSTFAGRFTGAGSLAKIGTGTVTLSGSNSFAGPTSVAGGLLALGDANALAGSGNVLFTGGTMQFGAANQADYSSRIVSSTAAITLDTNGQNVAFVSSLASSNVAGLTKLGTGTLTLAANSSYAGTTTGSVGVLRVAGSGTAFGSGTVNLANAAGVALELAGFSQSIGALTGGGATGGHVIMAGGTLAVGSANTSTTYSGSFGGAAGLLVKQGRGVFTLGGTTSSFSGVTVEGGALTVSPAAASTYALGTISRSAGVLALQPGASGAITVGVATPGSSAGQIIGPWAITGTGANATYAAHTGGTVGAYVASGTATGLQGLPNDPTANFLLTSATGTMPAVVSANTIRYTASTNFQPSSWTVNGLMLNGGQITGGTIQIGSSNELVLVTPGTIEINAQILETASPQGITWYGFETAGQLRLHPTAGNNLTAALNILGTGQVSLGGGDSTYGAINFGPNVQSGRPLSSGPLAGKVHQYGAISGDLGFNKIDAGTTRLLSASYFTGTTNIWGGSVEVASLPSIGTAGGLGNPTAANGTIFIGASGTTATLRYVGGGDTTDRAINLAGTTGGATIDASGTGGALVFSSAFTASGAGNKTLTLTGSSAFNNSIVSVPNASSGTTSVDKTGSGLWRMTGASGYSGQLRILDGTLVVASNVGDGGNSPFGQSTAQASLPQLGNSGAGVSGTAALLFDTSAGVTGVDRGFSVAALGAGSSQVAVIGASGTGTVTIGTNSTELRLGRSVTLQAADSATAVFTGLWKNATGGDDPAVAYTIGSANNAGVVVFESILSGSATALNVVRGTARLQTGVSDAINSATPVTIGSAGGPGTLDINGNSQTLSNVTFTGNSSSITGGTLRMAGSGTLAVSGTGHVISSVVALDAAAGISIATGGRLQMSAEISGANPLTKSGAGILQLTGVNTYTGTTSVTAGRLLVDGAGSLSNTDRVVINGAGAELKWNSSAALSSPLTLTQGTISGTGTISATGGVTVGSNAILSPGNSPGTQSYTTGLTWAAGGSYLWEINDWTGGAGTAYDQLAVSGSPLNITATSGSTFNILITSLTGSNTAGNVPNFDGSTNRTFTLATSSVGITGFNASSFYLDTSAFSNTYSGSFSITSTSTTVLLNYLYTPAFTTTTYTLSAAAGTANLRVGGTTSITATVTNTGTGTADSLAVSGLGVTLSPAGTVTLSPTSGTAAIDNGTVAGSGVFTGTAAGAYTFTPSVSSATNVNLATSASLTSTGTASVTVWNLATGSVAPTPISLGNIRTGTSFGTQALTITNTGTADFTEGLKAAFGTSLGSASTNSGTIAVLGSGSSNNTSMTVGLGGTQATAGVISGTQSVDLWSTGVGTSGLTDYSLSSQNVVITGTVWNLASGTISSPSPVSGTISLGSIIKGGTFGTQALTINNTAPTGGYSEKLDAVFGTLTGDLTTSGSISLLAAGGTSTNMLVGLTSGTSVGVAGGSVAVDFTSNGDGTSGLGTLSVGSQTVWVEGTVLEHSQASLASTLLTSSTINLGTWDYEANAWLDGGSTAAFSIFNLASTSPASLTAALELTGTSMTGNSAFSIDNLLNALVAGGTSASYTATFDPTGFMTKGTYTATFTFLTSDQTNLSGAVAGNTLTLTTSVIVVPEPQSLALAVIGIAAAAYALRRRK